MKKSDVGSPVVTETWEVFLREELNGWQRRIVKIEWNGGWTTSLSPFSHPRAIGIAWETRWFGERTERLAKELREVGPDGQTFVGPPLVLKASITVSKEVNVDSKDFHKRFCKSQLKAQKYASTFNEYVAQLPVELPAIEFLSCWVYVVDSNSGERNGFLVEPALDVMKYKKFNDNQGNIYTSSSHPCARKMTDNPGVSRYRHSIAAVELGGYC